MPVVIQTGRRRSAARSPAPVDDDDKYTRVSSRQTKGQKSDWRESSVTYDETKAIVTGIESVEVTPS
jgi:hypothetical protein